jgi:glutathione S-transferase
MSTTAAPTTAPGRTSKPQPGLVLWHLPVSIFSEKARWALDYKGLPHRLKTFRSGLHPLILGVRGKGTTVPVLDIEGQGPVSDSTAIIAAAEELQPEPRLYPADEAQRREALELEDFFDEHCGHELRRVAVDQIFRERKVAIDVFMSDLPRPMKAMSPVTFPLMARPFARRYYGINAKSVESARAKVIAAFDRADAQLGSGEYLVGDSFSVADLSAAAILSHLVLPPEYPYPSWNPEDVPRELREFRASLSKRPSFEWVLEMYRRHRRPQAGV